MVVLPAVRTPLLLLFALVPVLVACGTDPAPGDGSGGAEPTGPAAVDGGLAVRVAGVVTDGALCPGGHRPCLPLDREVAADADRRVIVTGRLVDGVLVIDGEEPIPTRPRLDADECGPEVMPDDSDAVRRGLADYVAEIPDEFAVQWISASGTLHLGVVGEAGPHLLALMDRDLHDHICVVGAFERSQRELDEALSAAVSFLQDGERDEGPRFFGGSGDPFAGVAVLEVEWVDAPLLAAIDERFGDIIELRSPITVLDDSFAELEPALAQVESDDAVDLEVTCGAARFEQLPPDPGEFAPLDDDARQALDRAATGGAAQEFAIVADAEWRIAGRTADRLVLLGVMPDGDDGYVTATFGREEDGWEVDGFGGCRVEVSAVGLGPATVQLDPARPPDPASSELPLVINERDCASGEAPVDREIVPIVVETDSTVEVTVLVAPVVGGAECPSNPWHPITVELEAPWSDRTLLDGSTRPPEERSWPPDDPELGG